MSGLIEKAVERVLLGDWFFGKLDAGEVLKPAEAVA